MSERPYHGATSRSLTKWRRLLLSYTGPSTLRMSIIKDVEQSREVSANQGPVPQINRNITIVANRDGDSTLQ